MLCAIIVVFLLYNLVRYRYENTCELCCSRYERFMNFLTLVPWHEERDTILTILTPTRRVVHLVMFKISIHLPRSGPEKLNSTLFLYGPISTSQLTFFQNPQILRTIPSESDVIQTPAPFPVWGFIKTMVIVISFARGRKLHQLTILLNSSKPNQTEW